MVTKSAESIFFMIIKYQDKFESIFYAILYSNLTGYLLVSKNEPDNLFNNNDFVDIDNFNWLEILNEHSAKYGEIKWLDSDNNQLIYFKKTIEFIFAQNNNEKYVIVSDLLKQAIKYGLSYVNNQALISRQTKIKINKSKIDKSRIKQKVILFENI